MPQLFFRFVVIVSEMLDPLPRSQWSPKCAYHLLARAGFGGTPSEVHEFFELGIEAAVAKLLGPKVGPVPLEAPWDDDTLPLERFREAREAQKMGDVEKADRLRREARREDRQRLAAMREAWVLRMIHANHPLTEKLTLFWHGHFATSVNKVNESRLMRMQNDTLRSEGFDNFASLTKAVSRDGAMIRWLDLQQSSASAPNENFARELLELFTLGEGHYTEADIREAARAFTGYRVNRRTGRFSFAHGHHDDGIKSFMGKARKFNGDGIIDVVVEQRQCARFIGGRLWEFFGGVPATPTFQRLLGDVFKQHYYEVRPFLKRVFLSKVFYSPNVVGRQIKSPTQWLVQSCRALEIGTPPPTRMLEQWMGTLGQQLFAPPNVRGWEGGRSWMSATTFTARTNYAGELTGTLGRGGNPNRPRAESADPAKWLEVNSAVGPSEKSLAIATRLYGPQPPRAVIATAEASLGNDADDPSALRAAAHALMSLPEYQLT